MNKVVEIDFSDSIGISDNFNAKKNLQANLEFNIKTPRSKVVLKPVSSEPTTKEIEVSGSGFIPGEDIIITKAEDFKVDQIAPEYPVCSELINYRNDIKVVKFTNLNCEFKGNPYLYNFEKPKEYVEPVNNNTSVTDSTVIAYKYDPTEFTEGFDIKDTSIIEVTTLNETILDDTLEIRESFSVEIIESVTDGVIFAQDYSNVNNSTTVDDTAGIRDTVAIETPDIP